MYKLICGAFLIIYAIFHAFPGYALSNKISTTFETGERSITDGIEDRDLSGNYNFNKYRLRFNHEISKATSYYLSYEFYNKDYDVLDNLDSAYNSWQAGLDHNFKDFKIAPLKISLDAGYKIKEYKNAPDSEYDRSNASIELGLNDDKDLWALHWRNGFINYDFENNGNDQLKLSTKLSGWRKFMDERLKIGPSIKFESVNNKNTDDRSETTINTAASYKVGLPYFKELKGFYEHGRNDTKNSDEEDRDDDLIFRYEKWYAGTENPLLEKLDTSFRYGQIRRDYFNSPNDYRNWYIENKTDFKIFNDKSKKINFSTEYQHKEADFHAVDALNYIKNSAKAELLYKIKNNWELTPGFKFTKYNYVDNATKKEDQYEVKVDFLKESLMKELDLKLTYRYIWKDYKYRNDITLWSVKAGLEYKF